MKKVLLFSLVFIFLGACLGVIFGFWKGHDILIENLPESKNAENQGDLAGAGKTDEGVKDLETQEGEIKIHAVGDIMLDRGVEYMIVKNGENDFKFPFLKISDYLKNADIVFGNLESLISDKGVKIGTVNSFRADPKSMEGLKYAGFNIVSVANNHALDYDLPALEDSLNRLKQANIDYIGGGFNEQEAFGLKILTVKGVKIGFLAYCGIGSLWWKAEPDRTGIAFITKSDLPKIKEAIKEAKKQVDVLIVSNHLGTEYLENPDNSQLLFDQTFIESGADLVIGHHPHVTQFIDVYSHGWIAYSLGNFVFDQGFSQNTLTGLVLEITIRNKKIENVYTRTIKMNKNFQPELSDKEE